MCLKDRLLLSLLKLVLYLEGWREIEPGLWQLGKCRINGDGNEIVRLIMRRLRAGERIKQRRIKNEKQNKSNSTWWGRNR